MKTENQYLEDLQEVRALMEKSSRFLSLSGLSGIMAGVYALIAAGLAYFIVYQDTGSFPRVVYDNSDNRTALILLGVITLFITILTGMMLTIRKAKKHNQPLMNKITIRLSVNLLIPLITGGVVILITLFKGFIGFVAPYTLIFYGLALVNASKYTYSDVRQLGIIEIVIGLLALQFIGYGILFWALGFGVGHIVYGTIMYFKYDRG